MVEPFARNNCHLRAHLILPVILPVREVAPDAAGDLNAGNKGNAMCNGSNFFCGNVVVV